MEVTINDILYVILTAAVPLLLRFIWQFVSVKVADTKYASALSDIYTAVEYVNQTFVDALKEKGCFDAEAQEHALKMAKDAAIEIMHTSTLRWLERSVIDLESWLTVQIEAAVKTAKPAKAVA